MQSKRAEDDMGVQTEEMRDLDKALADIIAIRSQLAAGTAFAGYGPAAIAATAGVALVTAAAQYLWLHDPTYYPLTFLFGWALAALLSGAIILTEMIARSRRHHSGLADAMIHQAVEQFLPAAVAGTLLAVVLWKFAPESLWLLPGLWCRSACSPPSVRCHARSRSRAAGTLSRALSCCCSQARATRCRPGPWACRLSSASP
jgi:hypothetical protein